MNVGAERAVVRYDPSVVDVGLTWAVAEATGLPARLRPALGQGGEDAEGEAGADDVRDLRCATAAPG